MVSQIKFLIFKEKSIALIYHMNKFTQTSENSGEFIKKVFHAKSKKRENKKNDSQKSEVQKKKKKIHENSDDE